MYIERGIKGGGGLVRHPDYPKTPPFRTILGHPILAVRP